MRKQYLSLFFFLLCVPFPSWTHKICLWTAYKESRSICFDCSFLVLELWQNMLDTQDANSMYQNIFSTVRLMWRFLCLKLQASHSSSLDSLCFNRASLLFKSSFLLFCRFSTSSVPITCHTGFLDFMFSSRTVKNCSVLLFAAANASGELSSSGRF